MFPELEAEEEEMDQMAQTSTTLSIIEMLAEPSQILKNAVVDLLHVQDDTEAALRALPELIQRLRDPDPNVAAQAAHMICMLSKQDIERFLRILSKEDAEALIRASQRPDDNARGSLAATLGHISTHEEGRLLIFRSGGIPELIRMLRSRVESIVHYAVTTLHNLLRFVETSKEEIIRCGGLEALVPLLRSPNPKLQALVADSLYYLLLERPQCKQSFLSLQGPKMLVDILTTTSYQKLCYAVIRCIRSISISPENKANLIHHRCLEALHNVLPFIEEPKYRLALLQAMRNLSDAATNLQTLYKLVTDLLILIHHSDDEEIVSCACGILSNLTCNNAVNKEAVCSNAGITILTEALNRFAHIEDITEPALCTMRHCTARHALAQQAQDEAKNANAFGVILALLATRRPPIVKAALGLVRNCALSNANLRALVQQQNIKGDTIDGIAIEVLERSGTILHQDFEALEDGVSILETVEGAVAALHQLARDARVANSVVNNRNVMTILVALMGIEQINSNEDDLMMREILGLLYQLTKTKEGAKAVEAYGPTPTIVDALYSPSKPVTAYASIILKNMGVNKPLDYQRRLRKEIHTAIPQNNQGYHGEGGWMNDGLEPELFNEMYNYSSLTEIRNIEAHNNPWFDTDL